MQNNASPKAHRSLSIPSGPRTAQVLLHGAVVPRARGGEVKAATDAAKAMSIYYRDQWNAVASELPGGAVEGMEGEAAASMSIYVDQWKDVASELPWGTVEEMDDDEEVLVVDDSEDDDDTDDEMLLDEDKAAESQMRSFRRGAYGCFEDSTSVRPMRYTDRTVPRYACCESALQIFPVQLKEIKDGLEWPLHVYGHVAVRDSVDYNRNVLFNRARDNCQILTQEDSHLLLIGPSRAVVLIDPVKFEIELRVRGEKESEDKMLSLKVFSHDMSNSSPYKTFTITKPCCSKRSTLEFTFAELLETVDATIDSIQVIDGSWPDHLRGKVVARTTSIGRRNIELLDSRYGRMPINCDGKIELSRSVVSVDMKEKLEVAVSASQVDDKSDAVVFTTLKASRSRGICDLGFCKVEITVAWSSLRPWRTCT